MTEPPPPDARPDGFPLHTPTAEMTEAEQVAYWRHYARRHQARANDYLRQLIDVRAHLIADDMTAAFGAIAPDLPRSVRPTKTRRARLNPKE